MDLQLIPISTVETPMTHPGIPQWNMQHIPGLHDQEKCKLIPDATEPILKELDPTKGFSGIYRALAGYQAE